MKIFKILKRDMKLISLYYKINTSNNVYNSNLHKEFVESVIKKNNLEKRIMDLEKKIKD